MSRNVAAVLWSMLQRVRPRVVVCVALVSAAVAPALYALRMQTRHWVDIPIWDEWDTPGITLLHFAEGTLSWRDLWAQHNESRKLFARLIYLASEVPLGWHVKHGMVLTYVAVVAASLAVWRVLRQTTTRFDPAVLIAWALANLVLFAPSQYENLLCGNAFEIYIPPLCLFGCVASNLSDQGLWRKTAWNCVFALIATYTFAHGMMLWVLAFPMPERPQSSTSRWRSLVSCYGMYVAVAAIAIGCYFIGYQRPPIAPPAARLDQLGEILQFALMWLGSPLRSGSVDARSAGLVVAALALIAVASAAAVLRKQKTLWRAYYPWISLAAFSFGSGAVTAVGRVNLGLDAVFSTGFDGVSSFRYHITSGFAHVAVVGLLYRMCADWARPVGWRHFAYALGAMAACVLFAMTWTSLLRDEWVRLRQFQRNRERAKLATTWAEVLPSNPEIFTAYPYIEGFAFRIVQMKQAQLIELPPISERVREKIARPPPDGAGGGALEQATLQGTEYLRFTGWAANPDANARADVAVLGWQAAGQQFQPFTVIATGRLRKDLVAKSNARALKHAGFDQQINITSLPPGRLEIRGWAVDLARQRVFPLSGNAVIDLPSR